MIKPQKCSSACKCNHCRLDSPCISHLSPCIRLPTCIVLHGYYSLGKTSGLTTKTAGIEILSQVVLCNVRSWSICQDIEFGFKQIHCSWKCKCKSIQYQEIKSNDLFKEINEQHIYFKVFCNYVLNFLYIIFNGKSFWWTE